MKKFFKFLFSFIFVILCTLLTFYGAVNYVKYLVYNEFFTYKESVCLNPGLDEGFVPQGMAVVEDKDLYMTSGYMKDTSLPSRIYFVDPKTDEFYHVDTYKNNEAFTGHLGGVAYDDGYIYIASEDHVYPLSIDDVLNKDKIEIGEGIKVNNQASYVTASDGYVYVGEFHYGPYVCENKVEHDKGTYYAICTKYSKDDLTTPLAIYSVPDKVQGFAIGEDGTIVLSTSWSVNSSQFFVYKQENIKENGTYKDTNAPLYILNNPSNVIDAPAMTEDLSYHDGYFYTMNESACDKYIFGKFFFEYKIYRMKF